MASFPLPAPSLCPFCIILQPKRNGTADFLGTSADFSNKLSRGGHGCLHCGQPFRPKPHNAVMQSCPQTENLSPRWLQPRRNTTSWSLMPGQSDGQPNDTAARRQPLICVCDTFWPKRPLPDYRWRGMAEDSCCSPGSDSTGAGRVTHASTTQDRVWGFGSPWCTCMQHRNVWNLCQQAHWSLPPSPCSV